MALEYTAENFTDALTRLPEYGGYDAWSGALREAYPDATFSPFDDDSYYKGFDYAGMPTSLGSATGPFTVYDPTIMQKQAADHIGSGNPFDSIYKAVWPTLTGLVNPQRSVMKAGPMPSEWELETAANAINPVGGGNLYGGKIGDDEGGKEHKGGIGEHLAFDQPTFSKTDQGHKDYLDWLFKNQAKTGYSSEEIMRLGAEFQNQIPTVTPTVGAGVGSGDAVENNVEKKFTYKPKGEIKQHLDGDVIDTSTVVDAKPDDGKVVDTPVHDVDERDKVIPYNPPTDKVVDNPVTTSPPTSRSDDKLREVENEAEEAEKAREAEVGQNEPIYADKPITSISSDSNVTADRPTDIPSPKADDYLGNYPKIERTDKSYLDITSKQDDNAIDNKELETVNNDIDTYLKTKGWSDSGEWGYARTRNMLTGGGLGPVVTEGALVPWQSMGQDASSRDYISNVDDIDRFPSAISSPDISEIAPKGEEKEGVKRVHSAGIGFDADAIANYGSDNSFDVTGASLFPKSTGRTEDGGIYFENAGDLGEWASGVTSATGIKGIQRKFNYKVFGPDGTQFLGIGNKIADASKALTKFAQDTFAFLGDPSKKKGDAPTPLMESMDNLRTEMSQFWDTNPNSQWGRKLFKPGETQDYGSLQPYAIVASLLNPPQALVTLANTVLHDFMYAAKGMFSKDANYKGNPVQDVLNGAFHLLGQGIKSVGKNAKELFSGKKKEGSTEEGTSEGKLEGEDAFMKQLFKDQENNKMRTLWDDHVMMNSSTALITQAFAGEGIPSKLYDKGMDFVNAIQSRRKAESERLHKEIMNDLGMLSTGASGDLFNLQTFMRDYSAEEGHQHFIDALEKEHRNRQK